MELQNFVPPTDLVIWSLIFGLVAFENQRWNRAIRAGRQGSNPIVPIVVGLTGLFGLVLWLGVVAAVLVWGGGWQSAIGLLIINIVGQILVEPIFGVIFGGDNWIIFILATVAMYPIGYVLALEALSLSR